MTSTQSTVTTRPYRTTDRDSDTFSHPKSRSGWWNEIKRTKVGTYKEETSGHVSHTIHEPL